MTVDTGDEDRVAVVGGGVIGCAVAADLARDHEVALFERDRIAGGATGRSAGLVTIEPAFSDALPIADRAMAEFERLDGEETVAFHAVPSLEPVPTETEAIARRRLDRLRERGVSVRWLDPDAVATRYPLDLEGHAGALVFERAGWVDPHALTEAYRRAATNGGARVDVGTTVRNLTIENGSVVGIETDGGRKECFEAVVVAAGWATPDLVAPFVDLPVRPYRTQCVRVEGPPELGDCPMGWVPSADCYFRPDGDGLLVGGMPSFVDDPATTSRREDAALRRHVASALEDLLAVADVPRLADGWAGVDLATPDGRPIVDAPDGAPTGLVVATGFHGRGIMTAPVVGPVVRSVLSDGTLEFSADPFRLARLDSSPDEFEVPGIGEG